jgi:putative hydrolase of the HAD superfamily
VSCLNYSYEIGLLKPEIEIYEYAIGKLSCNPDEIVFFDDNEANVQTAIKAGMNAYKVTGFEDLKDKMGILSLL